MKQLILLFLALIIFQDKAISSYQDDLYINDILIHSKIPDIISPDRVFSDIKPVLERVEKFKNNKSKKLNKLSGLVYIGDNLLPEGDIFLLEKEKGKFVCNKSVSIKNGIFEFDKLDQGKYSLYVIPICDYDFFYFPKYLPTYSGNSYKWENSVEKDLSEDMLDFSIYLKSYSDPFYGHESISGKITYQTNYFGLKEIPIPIFLLNELKEPMDFRIANSISGFFSFDYLPTGIYYLHPEIPGIRTEDLKVIVKPENNNYNINFLISNESITAEFDNEINEIYNGKYIKVFLNQNTNFPVVCELVNMSGCSVNKNIYWSDEVCINTTNMSAGIYILRIRTFDNKLVKTKKVYINNY